MKPENVVILGAGASKSEGAPLQRDLFRSYFEAVRDEGAHFERQRELTTFFDTFFGIDLDGGDLSKANFPTFEEVLGIIEIALQRGERLKGFGVAANDPRLQQIRAPASRSHGSL